MAGTTAADASEVNANRQLPAICVNLIVSAESRQELPSLMLRLSQEKRSKCRRNVCKAVMEKLLLERVYKTLVISSSHGSAARLIYVLTPRLSRHTLSIPRRPNSRSLNARVGKTMGLMRAVFEDRCLVSEWIGRAMLVQLRPCKHPRR